MIAVNTSVKVVKKPWGREEWLHHNDRYVMKKIVLRAGQRTSLQSHRVKHETNHIVSGKATLEIQDEQGVFQKFSLKAGDTYTVPQHRQHRLTAIKDVVMIETSTPEVDDVIRHQDDTGRGDGRIESEHVK
ncbi:MAG: hypothetical protein UU67_C0035G0006 [Candidatus Daviesbacteria bacterium GW2011_GWB1_41_5]|uniref:Mannose-6-phosphate isomerase type II C-terminal domain-containing protein n=1 Tax=Candidatus Daviesbacteria bacterium GW2011_GWB1_41_5 TaxID=1618429 RepID=A0A0G0WJB3_9BACT|nr:MAG: hypothetical protein UU67_C0035G0006 [Candidatus Daviesbacteria bacterium GW2011_GWB1_41_5]